MIVEIVFLLSMLAGGSAGLHLLGLRGWGLPFLGFATGVAAYLGIGFVQVVTGIPSYPVVTLAVSAGVPLVAWVIGWIRRRPLGFRPLWPAVAGLGLVVVAIAARLSHLVAWSPDSFRYLVSGALIARNDYDVASSGLIPKRLLGVPLLHAAGNIDGEFYLPAITPLLAVALVGCLAWFAWTTLRPSVAPRLLVAAIAVGLAMLVTINRFVFHAFYINGHLLFALLLLLVVGSAWALRADRADRVALTVVLAVAIPALVVTRADSSIVIALALLPVLLSDRIRVRLKVTILLLLGLSTVVWQVRVLAAYLSEGADIPLSVSGLLAFGAVVTAAVAVVRVKFLQTHARVLLWAVLALMWLALGVLVLRDRELFTTSLIATVRNFVGGAGSWGLSALLIVGLTALAIGLITFPESRRLTFVLAAFVPLAFLLVYFREEPYRVGDGDSLNRMVVQFLPVAVLLLIAVVAEGRWRWSRAGAAGDRRLPSTE